MVGVGAEMEAFAVSEIVAFLEERSARGGMAPHVAAALARRLDADTELMHAVADALTSAQRLGRKPLPEPLPAVGAIRARIAEQGLSDDERDLVLVAVLATDPRIDVLAAIIGTTATAVLHLLRPGWAAVESGRCRITDAALRVGISSTAAPVRYAQVHARLAHVYEGEGDRSRAVWHRARGATERDPAVVPPLLSATRRLLTQGGAAAAFRTAAEAFDHATGDAADTARVLAGTAALGAGWYEEAVEWLSGIRTSASSEVRRRALAPRMLAATLLDGRVRAPDPRRRPRDDRPDAWWEWGRTAAMGAILAAERRSTAALRAWLGEVREADRCAGAGGALRDPVVGLCRLLDGEIVSEPVDGSTPIGAFASSVSLVAADPGRVSRTPVPSGGGCDPVLAGAERTPLARAYTAVVDVLALHWQGAIDAARDRMLASALELPAAVPLAGLGAQLARRLDIIADGRPGGVALGLTAALPAEIRPDPHQDLAFQSYLAGDVESAAAHVALWHDRGAPQPTLPVGVLDEVGAAATPRAAEPDDAVLARRLSRRARELSGSGSTREYREYFDISERLREIRSPYLRGRVEALLGTACAIRDDRTTARRHLRTARRLFEASGAGAWSRVVASRLARLGDGSERARAITSPSADQGPADPGPADPLAPCRAAWSAALTERELEVAMLIVDGATNRAIAERLALSVRTVEVHAGRVFAKLEVRNRVELTVLAHRTSRFV